LRQLYEAAQIGATDPSGARYLYDTYNPMLQTAGHDIRTWLMTRMTIVSAPSAAAVVVGK
jgi:hypothetical protein